MCKFCTVPGVMETLLLSHGTLVWRGTGINKNTVKHSLERETRDQATLKTRSGGSQKSIGGWWGSCLAARRTAAWWRRSSPPRWGAAGPWERPPAAQWATQAPEALWRTALPGRPRRRGELWPDTPRQQPVWPEQTKQSSVVSQTLFRGEWWWWRWLGGVKSSQWGQGQPHASLTLRAFRRTTEPDFLNRPSVSTWASSFMHASTRKLWTRELNEHKKGAAQDWICNSTCEHNRSKGQNSHLPRHAPAFHVIVWQALQRRTEKLRLRGKNWNQDNIN